MVEIEDPNLSKLTESKMSLEVYQTLMNFQSQMAE